MGYTGTARRSGRREVIAARASARSQQVTPVPGASGAVRLRQPPRARCWSTTGPTRADGAGVGLLRRRVGARGALRVAGVARGRGAGRDLLLAGVLLARVRAGSARPAVGAVEPAALEHDPHRGEHLAQPTGALGAVGQRRVGERLHGLEPVSAGGAGVLVGRHGFLRSWHSQPQSASLPRPDQSVPPSIVTPDSGRSAAVTRRSWGSAGSSSTSSPSSRTTTSGTSASTSGSVRS